MRDPVDELLFDRSQDLEGIGRMFTLSVLAHVLLIAGLALVPADWGSPADEEEMLVMTISLGGAPGAQSGGMTPIGGRPIQEVAPLVEPPRPQPVRPPAAETPEMVAPDVTRTRPSPPVTRSVPEATGRTPTRGPEPREGSAVAETGGRGTGFGLSTGGGGTGGYLDVRDFCCPDYLGTMLQLLQRNWDSRQEVSGETMMKFTIQRDGRITDIELERSSGFVALDLSAQRALLLTRQLPPLPRPFTEDHLTVHLNFQYQR